MTAPNGEALEQQVIRLLQTNRYDPAILPQLEDFVLYQVAQQFSDSDANLAVLKLYQFHPHKYNSTIVAKILIKSLMALPTTDFLAALYLIPEHKQVDEPIPVITRLASLLERGDFRGFWDASGACRDLLESVPGSIHAFREFMGDVIGRVYRTVDVPVLRQLLDVEGDAVKDFCSGRGWSIAGGVVTIPGNEENQPRPPIIDEHLSFKQVASKML